jgi:hypothetical protein
VVKILDMRILTRLPLFLIVLIVQYQNCGPVPQPNQYADLMHKMQTRIQEIVANDYCVSDADCKTLAFGAKACGGPHSYIVHSTTANWNELENLVNQYNQYEYQRNLAEGVISDCSLLAEPTDLKCTNNKCLAP